MAVNNLPIYNTAEKPLQNFAGDRQGLKPLSPPAMYNCDTQRKLDNIKQRLQIKADVDNKSQLHQQNRRVSFVIVSSNG